MHYVEATDKPVSRTFSGLDFLTHVFESILSGRKSHDKKLMNPFYGREENHKETHLYLTPPSCTP